MTNERRRERLQNWQRQAWLTEYEGCRQHNISYASQYWIIVGIFMAINTALLGGAAYSLVTSSTPLHEYVRWPVLVLGGGMIIILLLLKRYLKRVTYVMRLNYERMREIEAELGMWRNWRVDVLDRWNRLSKEDSGRKLWDKVRDKLGLKGPDKLSAKDRNRVWNKVWDELKNELSDDEFKKLSEGKERLSKLVDRYPSLPWWQLHKPFRRYEPPSGPESMTCIFRTVMLLWVFLITMAFLIPC